MASTGTTLGPVSETMNIDEEIRHICNKVKFQTEQMMGKACVEYIPLLYRSQAVGSFYYWVKILIDLRTNTCIHVKIYVVVNEHTVLQVKQEMTVLDEIVPF